MIREAVLDDLPALLALGEMMHTESPRFRRLRFSRERLAATLTNVIGQPHGFAMVMDKGGAVVGGMICIVMQHWCSEDLIATDLATFVHPDHRGSLAPMRMVKAYREWADARGAVFTQIGVSTGINVKATTRLFQACGFMPVGTIMESECALIYWR